MTDNEIIKGLECCNHEYVWQKECFDCEYATFEANCGKEMMKDALDLIKRQQAKIERLEMAVEINANMVEELNNLNENIRAKAIKEFAEKLKQQAFNCDISFGFGKEHYTKAVAVLDIDKLVEEMTESEG